MIRLRFNITIIFVVSLSVSCNNSKPKATNPYNLFQNSQKQTLDEGKGFLYGGNTVNFMENEIDNQLSFTQNIFIKKQDLEFSAKKIPNEVYLFNKGIKGTELADALLETKNEQLFFFEFKELQNQDLLKKYYETDLDKGVSYLSFGILNDFILINSNEDTLVPNYSLYERNFHISPVERLIISFPAEDNLNELRLIYRDKLFGKGLMTFTFPSQQFLVNNFKKSS